MDLALWLAGAALCLSIASAIRAYVPPQQRTVSELRALVEELQADLDSLHTRQLKRDRQGQMDQARAVHESKKTRQAKIEEEALAIIERGKPATPADVAGDPEQLRQQLRARLGFTRH